MVERGLWKLKDGKTSISDNLKLSKHDVLIVHDFAMSCRLQEWLHCIIAPVSGLKLSGL